MSLQSEVDDAVLRLRRAGTDLQTTEVKTAAGGLPKSVAETVSAFANARGGLLILGLDERRAFAPAPVDVRSLAADLASACADQLEPPVRPDIDVVEVDGQPVVVAQIDELPTDRKPCYVRSRGLDRGCYLRTHDGDRLLTTYEVHVMVTARGQASDDMVVVPDSSPDDLDPDLVAALASRLRRTRREVFGRLSPDDLLRQLGIVVETADGPRLTLAGLLSLGRYPQRFYPQLNVTFVVFPTTTGEPVKNTRFLDNQAIDGPIPLMLSTALAAMYRNMRRKAVIHGLGREDVWDYPDTVIRELVVNALLHRDYHPLALGAQVRIEVYPDRFEVSSPGGFFGPVERSALFADPVSTTRNRMLARLLEDIELPGTGRSVAENRGTGLLEVARALRQAGLEPPTARENIREFRVVVHNHALLDEDAIAWLATIGTDQLSDRQRLGLVFLHRNETISSAQYRTLTGCDPRTAVADLSGLALRGLVERRRERGQTVWSLISDDPPGGGLDAAQPPPTSRSDAQVAGGSTPGATRSPVPAAADDAATRIRRVLSDGPRTVQELAELLEVSRESTRRLLRRLEDAGEVQPTEQARRSPRNRWRIVNPR